ncbi:unnamed protein product [Pieris macdunnoughi]|uniref:Uncharacterized protein n=1 Tax=Pieris macdunnoughi TaxID=345717 RepID=A0A821Y3Y4_9NEOP|nr:unnamed protein product [Pieris macdunnoughi]
MFRTSGIAIRIARAPCAYAGTCHGAGRGDCGAGSALKALCYSEGKRDPLKDFSFPHALKFGTRASAKAFNPIRHTAQSTPATLISLGWMHGRSKKTHGVLALVVFYQISRASFLYLLL